MQWRYNLAHFLLASIVALGLMPLMVGVDAQARITFSSERDGNLEIYVMDADGRNQQRLTRNASPDTDPSWSPDGKRIAFVSEREGNSEIYVMNADGARQVQRRTRNGRADTEPAWFDPAFAVKVVPAAVAPSGKKPTVWGGLKRVNR